MNDARGENGVQGPVELIPRCGKLLSFCEGRFSRLRTENKPLPRVRMARWLHAANTDRGRSGVLWPLMVAAAEHGAGTAHDAGGQGPHGGLLAVPRVTHLAGPTAFRARGHIGPGRSVPEVDLRGGELPLLLAH